MHRALSASLIALSLVLQLPATLGEDTKGKKITIRFQSYDGNPKQPDKMSFQVNVAGRQPAADFNQIGGTISGTRWKIVAFVHKALVDKYDGTKSDFSSLIVEHAASGTRKELTFGQPVELSE